MEILDPTWKLVRFVQSIKSGFIMAVKFPSGCDENCAVSASLRGLKVTMKITVGNWAFYSILNF